MRIMIFGATGALGQECVSQSLDAGHEVSVYVRTPGKLAAEILDRVVIHEGDGLDGEAILRTLFGGCDGILFAPERVP